eukprot:COSAG03_NODE_5566_length_1218_cov_1.819482_1_plen_96_part_00
MSTLQLLLCCGHASAHPTPTPSIPPPPLRPSLVLSFAGSDSLRVGKNSTLSNLLTKRGPFSSINASLTGMAAVSNFGDNVNWTGSILGTHRPLAL